MADILERISQFGERTVARLYVRSALNPLLWLTGVTGVLGLIGAITIAPPVQYAMVVFMFIGPITTVAAYRHFVRRDPENLRSESFVLRKMTLGMIEEKGGAIPLKETSVEAIANMEYEYKGAAQPGENGK